VGEPNSEVGKAGVNSQIAQTITCRCGKEVDAQRNHCIYCGRPLYRICFCGKRIPRSLSSCPYCGMRWDREKKRVRYKRLPTRERLKILFRCVGFGLAAGVSVGLVLEIIRLIILNFLLSSIHSTSSSLHSSSESLSSPSPPSFVDIIAKYLYNFIITIFTIGKRFINCEFFLKYPLVGISIVMGIGIGVIVAYRQLTPYHHEGRHKSIVSHKR